MIGKYLKLLVDKHGWSLIRPAWRCYLAGREEEFISAKDFAEKPGRWMNLAAGKASAVSAETATGLAPPRLTVAYCIAGR